MSDTDDTDVLVLIPHDFFTVSSSEDEQQHQPLTLVTKPLHRKFCSAQGINMSNNNKSANTTPNKNGDTRRSFDLSSLRKSSPQKFSFPSKTLPSSKNGTPSKLRHSTSDLPNLSDNQPVIGRQRSLTGDLLDNQTLIGRQRTLTGENNSEIAANQPTQQPTFKNPEQPEYLDNVPPKNIPSTSEGEHKNYPYVGEHTDYPFVCGDNIGSVPDLGFGIREFLATLKPSYPQNIRTPQQSNKEPVEEEPCVKRYFSPLGGDNFGSRRQLKFDDHSENDTILRHENLSAIKRPSAFVPVGSGETRNIGEPSSLPSDLSRPELTGSSSVRSPNIGLPLPSLTQLWREEITGESLQQKGSSTDVSLLQQRLDEERYRRMHCEELISELQQKLLRETEKVAVATQIDSRKDEYMNKLRETYESTANRWQYDQDRLKFEITEKNELCAATIQRLRGCERELSKALDLASGFQQRSMELEREKTETEAALRSELMTYQRKCNELEQELMKVQASTNVLELQDSKKIEQLAVLQNLLEDTHSSRSQIEENNKKLIMELEEKNSNILKLEAEKESQITKLSEYRNRVDSLEQQKTSLTQSLEELRKKEKMASQEIRQLSQVMDQSKQSLKEQYQNQLDQVVRAKLNEFQNQLDNAEASLKHQWENKEAELRSKHARALSEIEQRHLVELRQVEERHGSNIAWWQRSLSQAMSQIQELTSELESQEKNREKLAARIKFMLQAQYHQAANLIWDPTDAPVAKNDMEKSSELRAAWSDSSPAVYNRPFVSNASSDNETNGAGAVTSGGGAVGKTMLTSQMQTELKNYIETLLSRPAGYPMSGDFPPGSSGGKITDIDFSKLSLNFKDTNTPKTPCKDNQKPPWK